MVKKEARKVLLKDAQGGYLVPVIDPKDRGGFTPNLLDFKWADHLLNDIRWLRGDTFSWQSGLLYVAAYNKLVEEWNNPTSVTLDIEKVGTPTVSEIGTVNGFSSTSYLKKNISIGITKEDIFPITLDFTTSTDVSTTQALLDIEGFSCLLEITSNGLLQISLGNNGTGFNITSDTVGITALQASTHYVAEINYDGTNYTVQLTDVTANTVTQEITVASTELIGVGTGTTVFGIEIGTESRGDNPDTGYVNPFLGTLNVADCKISDTWHGSTYRTSENGFKLADCLQEQTILNKFRADGVAWYYILDKDNTRFKLPRRVALVKNDEDHYLYFYVGDYEQDAISQTAGMKTEILNEKVDRNLSNLSAVGQAILDKKVEVEALLEQNGYAKFTWKNGNKISSLIVQWGQIAKGNVNQVITYPISFSQRTLNVSLTITDTLQYGYDPTAATNITLTSFVAYQTLAQNYLAVGY